ncbi:hypothetical protein AMR72_12100 [Flavobacterium psychrophilum]|nr:hypothetical protein AMR72_12100 [Flavobacterium psychrophilum]AOE53195.1 hypothetical protein ALW18_12090 [Flavobacterium psychrophilum]
MRKIVLFGLLALLSCKEENSTGVVRSTPKDSTQPVIEDIKPNDKTTRNTADYNGDGIKDVATIVLTKKGEGNPVEDGTPDEYSITFSNKKLPALPIGCCDAIIISEGDLDNDGADEFSVFQSPMNGCAYTMTTYSFKQGKWQKLVEPFIIPTACEDISTAELEGRIFAEDGKVYIMETDQNDEKFKTIKTEVTLPH